ncbi:MAG: carbohydrate ABC transporter substrate-binding protein [Clostridiales bacterium]|nr:carbohydrate ABC transporter substrate-binding protein [Clostridiales bacterium]
MKKRIALALAMAICLSLLCTVALADKVTVNFFHRWPNEPKNSYINSLIDEFEAANPDIDIVADCVLNDSYKEKIRVLVSTDALPDVFFSWSGVFGENLTRSGRVLALDDVMARDSEWSSQIVEGQWAPFNYNGKQYGAPWSMDGKAFFYNVDVFNELGIEIPTTLNELYAVCEKLKENGYDEPISAGFSAPWAVSHYLGTICQRVVDPEVLAKDYTGGGDFSDPAYIEALNIFKKLGEYMTSDPCSVDHEFARNAFIMGVSPMCYMQLAEMKYMRDDEELNYAFFNFPAVEDGKGDPGQLTGAPEGMMISATAKPEVQEAAIKFMEFVISKEGGHRMIAECGEISCVKGAWDETNCDEKQLEAIDLILAATEPAVWQDCATEATIANAFMNGGQLLLTGDMTAEDVMASVQTAAAALK